MIQHLNNPVQKAIQCLPTLTSPDSISGSIHRRIQGGYIVSLTLVLAIMLCSIFYLQSSYSNFIASTHTDRERRWKNTEIYLTRTKATESIRAYFLSSDITYLDQYNKEIHDFNNTMDELLKSEKKIALQELNLQLKRSSDALSLITQKNIDLSKLGFPQSALFLWEQETQVNRNDINQVFDQINEELNIEQVNIIKNERAKQFKIFTITTLLVILGVTVSAFLGLLIARSLSRPIEIIRASTAEISRGNFQVHLPVNGQDEVSQLAQSVNTMANRITAQFTTSQENAARIERQRIARDMHDELAQTLFAAKLIAAKLSNTNTKSSGQHKQTLEQLSQQLQHAHVELRTLITQMNSEQTQHDNKPMNLADSIARFLHRISDQNDLEIQTEIEITVEPPLKIAIAFYRITQEALNNVAKHSHASTVDYQFKADGSTLVLTIEDNGNGITTPASTGFGIAGMRQRAREISAQFNLISDYNGTRIRVEWEGNNNE